MFKIQSEAHGRVLSAVDDIKSCCEVRDDFYSDYNRKTSDLIYGIKATLKKI